MTDRNSNEESKSMIHIYDRYIVSKDISSF